MRNTYGVLETLQEVGMPLLIHGEVTDPDIDIFDREAVFIERQLKPLMGDFPELKIVLEHITTREAADFVSSSDHHLAATITPQHLLFNRNQMLVGGIRPHYYCLPILKRDLHRQALVQAATSGNAKFFLGSDSAPHLRSTKENACGCAGCFTSHAALELYAEVFAAAEALDQLEAFASLNGPAFYGLPVNSERIRLEVREWQPPAAIEAPGGELVPLRADQPLKWAVTEASS
jgi:dihydroorotase